MLLLLRWLGIPSMIRSPCLLCLPDRFRPTTDVLSDYYVSPSLSLLTPRDNRPSLRKPTGSPACPKEWGAHRPAHVEMKDGGMRRAGVWMTCAFPSRIGRSSSASPSDSSGSKKAKGRCARPTNRHRVFSRGPCFGNEIHRIYGEVRLTMYIQRQVVVSP